MGIVNNTLVISSSLILVSILAFILKLYILSSYILILAGIAVLIAIIFLFMGV